MTLDRLLSLEITYGSAFMKWFLGFMLVCCCETWLTIQLLKRYTPNPHSTREVFPFSVADFVTLGRGILVACVAGFIFLPKPSGLYGWLPGSLYFVAVLADYFDGYLARLQNSASEFGAALDRNFDAIITLIGSLLGIFYGHLPLWYLTVGLAFYVFSCAAWIMKKSGREVFDLPSGNYRRIVGGSNAVFIGLALTPALPVRWLSFLATLYTFLILAGFFRDWFSVIGVKTKLPINKLHSKIN
jgi:CDP-diacylglycerol---glycerol-3-phosphate 3-phosphatidyltransferase